MNITGNQSRRSTSKLFFICLSGEGKCFGREGRGIEGRMVLLLCISPFVPCLLRGEFNFRVPAIIIILVHDTRLPDNKPIAIEWNSFSNTQ